MTDERITEMAMTHQSAHALARAIEAEVRAECESLQAKVAELEKVALAYEEQIVLHNKTLDELKYTGLAAAAEAKRGDELQAKVKQQSAEIERLNRGLSIYTLAFEQECETTDVQAERIAELEQKPAARYLNTNAHLEAEAAQLAKVVAEQSELIEQCEKALKRAWGYGVPDVQIIIDAALAAIAAMKGGAK